MTAQAPDPTRENSRGVRAMLTRPEVYELWSRLVGAVRARQTLVSTYLHPGPQDRILDLGCGPGDLLDFLPPHAAYTGVDISAAYIDSARRRFGARGDFHVGDASTYDQGERSCELIIAAGVLHHLDDDQVRALLAGAARALTPGGRIVAWDPLITPDQNAAARAIVRRDRGQHVRDTDGYLRLAHSAFEEAHLVARHDLLRIPYTHSILECRAPLEGAGA
jgi:SAM-dependent methyltransferase